ncbi:hypothetical protein SOV92_17745 [Pectobacterium brasiliense]|uniref:Uncharacterized protein n=1 Tax=Pectobacterium brasiliense TaxID=180957 RepID=A0AAW9H6P7_9GAMM|nr:hypothetical protein [Pectobacterium brasiliense]MDY4379646.1 hypothetical protein [Pectobacterium brasiliense]
MSTEIKNKEKSLTELMVRILKEPLNPIESSMKALHDDVLDTKERIEEVNDTLGASSDDILRMMKQQYADMEHDVIPTFISSLQEYISQQTTTVTNKVALSLGEQSVKQEEYLNAVAENMLYKFTSIWEGQREVKQSIAELSQQLVSASQRIHTEHVDVTQRLDMACESIAKDIEVASSSIKELLTESMSDMVNGTIPQLNNHSDLLDALNLQQKNLSEKFSASQSKLRTLTIMIGIFFASTIGYIGYDIWHHF